jgi:prevent-host-death family protein
VYRKAIAYHDGMTGTTTLGVRELRDNLGKRIDAAHFLGEHTIVKKNGEPRAVLVPYADWLASRPAGVRPPSPPA